MGKEKETRVLIVDDDSNASQCLSDVLEGFDYSCEVASNGQEGLNLFRSEKFDVVISDINMPIINGVEMAQSIKKENPESGIILMTAVLHQELAEVARQSGIEYILGKPLDMNRLIKTVERITK